MNFSMYNPYQLLTLEIFPCGIFYRMPGAAYLFNLGMASLRVCGLGAAPPGQVLCVLPLSSLTLVLCHVQSSAPSVFSAKLQQKKEHFMP